MLRLLCTPTVKQQKEGGVQRGDMQSAEELRKAFPALVPHVDDAATLWQRRCRACGVVSAAMAAVPPPGVYRPSEEMSP